MVAQRVGSALRCDRHQLAALQLEGSAGQPGRQQPRRLHGRLQPGSLRLLQAGSEVDQICEAPVALALPGQTGGFGLSPAFQIVGERLGLLFGLLLAFQPGLHCDHRAPPMVHEGLGLGVKAGPQLVRVGGRRARGEGFLAGVGGGIGCVEAGRSQQSNDIRRPAPNLLVPFAPRCGQPPSALGQPLRSMVGGAGRLLVGRLRLVEPLCRGPLGFQSPLHLLNVGAAPADGGDRGGQLTIDAGQVEGRGLRQPQGPLAGLVRTSSNLIRGLVAFGPGRGRRGRAGHPGRRVRDVALGHRDRARWPPVQATAATQIARGRELVVERVPVLQACASGPIELARVVARSLLGGADPRRRRLALLGQVEHEFSEAFELLASLVGRGLLKRFDLPPQSSLLGFESFDLAVEPGQLLGRGRGGGLPALLVAGTVAPRPEALPAASQAPSQVAQAVGPVDVEEAARRLERPGELGDASAVLVEVVEGLGGFGESLLGHLWQRVHQVVPEFQVDAVADPGAAHLVDETDVLLDGRPAEEPLLQGPPVVAPPRSAEHLVAVEFRPERLRRERRAARH